MSMQDQIVFVTGANGGIGSSMAPAVSCGTVASSRPSAAITAEIPVGVERTIGSPSSIARIRACARCWGGPEAPNQASLEGAKIKSGR